VIDIQTLKSHASGQWLQIIQTLAPQLSHACQRPGVHSKCPCHGSKDGFRLYPDAAQTGGGFCNLSGGFKNGISLLMWTNGWDFQQTAEAISSHLGLAGGAIPTIKPIPKPERIPEKDWEVEKQRLQAIWDATESDNGRIAKYLQHRGLNIAVPTTLRLHSKLAYIHVGPYVQFPCMIARITRGGEMVGIFRTWLDEAGPGKADVSQPKKSWKCVDKLNGGAIELFRAEPGKPLVLCEGIETAMGINQMLELPTWACTSARLLEEVEVPEDIFEIIIAGDLDRNGKGQKAAEQLAQRLHAEGKQVKVALPPGPLPEGLKGLDWLDALNESLEVAHA